MTGRVVTVTGGKGGPGTTTLAVGLAAAWAAAGDHAVLLVDLDPAGGDVAAHLVGCGVDALHGLLPLASLAGPSLDPAEVAGECVQVDAWWWVLAGLPRPDVTALVSGELLRSLLDCCRELAEIVVVDAGRLLPGAPAVQLVLAADVAVLATRPDLPGALAALRAVDALPTLDGPGDDGRLRPVAVAAPRGRSRQVAELARALDRPLAGVIPADPRGLRRALRSGRPPRRGRLARAYARLSADLLALEPASPTDPSASDVDPGPLPPWQDLPEQRGRGPPHGRPVSIRHRGCGAGRTRCGRRAHVLPLRQRQRIFGKNHARTPSRRRGVAGRRGAGQRGRRAGPRPAARPAACSHPG